MQPHNDDQCAKTVDLDGRRHAQRSAFFTALGMAVAKALNLDNRAVHIAQANAPVDMGAKLTGSGGAAA